MTLQELYIFCYCRKLPSSLPKCQMGGESGSSLSSIYTMYMLFAPISTIFWCSNIKEEYNCISYSMVCTHSRFLKYIIKKKEGQETR